MTDYLRVKVDGPDHEVTITREQFDAQPDAFKKVDKDAVDAGGVPIPPKYRTSVAKKAAETKTPSRVATNEAATATQEGN
jgi:hypothetical protein